MKFISIKISPKSNNGLESDLLEFGDHITQLFGPTGTGKTPIVKSIPFCLGYSVVFRQEIYERCDYVSLIVSFDSENYTLKRYYLKGREVNIEVVQPDGHTFSFYNESDYSEYLFKKLGMERRVLVGTDNSLAKPYTSTLLPIFYVNQDDGFTNVYKSSNNFIKDQFSEMVRYAFNLPLKNSYDLKKNKLEAKKKLDLLDSAVTKRKNSLELLNSTVKVNRSAFDIEEDISRFSKELDELDIKNIESEDLTASLDHIIQRKKVRLGEIKKKIALVSNRRLGFEDMLKEIGSEIDTLNMNEESRQVFMSFGEICSSIKCQMFSRSSDSYSKNLVYLKDQIKDMEANDKQDEIVEVSLKSELYHIQEDLNELINERSEIRNKSVHHPNFKIITDLKVEIYKLQILLADAKKLDLAEREYIRISNERDRALNAYEAYKTSGKEDLEVLEFRKELRSLYISWLDQLRTTSISYDIGFKNDFDPIMGGETVNQISGSTGSRSILAYHASLFELAAKRSPINFLIIDAPKQHETENSDLDNYIKRLKVLCSEFNLQLIFSATEYEYEGDVKDSRWVPLYYKDSKKMFMKTYEH